jgi:hypothetical protein
MTIHETIPVLIWADVDTGIAPMVIEINTIAGARTHASCQGSIGDGGQEPYGPHVDVSWNTSEALNELKDRFDVEIEGDHFGTARPK